MVKFIEDVIIGEKTYSKFLDTDTGITYMLLNYKFPHYGFNNRENNMTFKFESPSFDRVKEEIRQTYNRITLKSEKDIYAEKDSDGNINIKRAYKMNNLEGLIEKYSKRHKKLTYQLDSDLLNAWQIELVMLELETITDFLKDLRLIKANNE